MLKVVANQASFVASPPQSYIAFAYNQEAVMKNLILLGVVMTLTIPTALRAEDKITPQAMLAIAKITGACGIMDEMLSFQKKTKMAGGDDFVVRFWETESARQGKTVQEMSEDCDKAMLAYDSFWKSMELKKE